VARPVAGFTKPIEYPESDGKPVTEGDVHFDTFHSLWLPMKAWAVSKGDRYYGGGLFVYCREGDPSVRLVLDGFVAFGTPPGDRNTFKTWVEGTLPSVVFEITSRKTRRVDFGEKWRVYQDVRRVSEYFLFDPREEYLDPPLQGFRRVRGAFQPLKPRKDGTLVSRRLSLTLAKDDYRLTLRDFATGETIPTEQERRAAEREAEIERLQAELAALKKK
jgi:Uma2 family endonuclease